MKYIIEIKPEYEDSFKGLMILGAKDSNIFIDVSAVDDLKELTSDYINEHFGSLQQDAYDKGYKDGRNVTETQAHDDAYQRGLDDAWEAARKILKMPDPPYWGVFEEYKDDLFRKITAAEAIEKLKAYEEKQKTDNCIEIGDEVNWDGDNYIVTYRNIDINTGVIQDYDLLGYDGSVADHIKKCSFVKTGRHFDIQKILEEMKG